MKKERAKMYEEMQFDSYAYAVDVKEQAEKNLEGVRPMKKMAVTGTVCGLVPFVLKILSSVLQSMFDGSSTGVIETGEITGIVATQIGIIIGLAIILKISAIVLHVISFVLSVRIYKKIGGFNKAFEWARNVTVFGWYICPIFPFDLMLAVVLFFYSLYALVFSLLVIF